MASWLSFWNQDQRVANLQLAGKSLDQAWIPWADGKVVLGDVVFAVGVDDGRLLLITRMVARSVRSSDPETEQITVTSSDPTKVSFDRVIPPATVDRLRFMLANRTQSRFRRDAAGQVRGDQFEGRASVRKLTSHSTQMLNGFLSGATASDSASRDMARGLRTGRAGTVSRRATAVDVPVEEGAVEGYEVAPSGKKFDAVRDETRLQRRFADYLSGLGCDVVRKKIYPPGVRSPLYSDLFNRTRNQLIEVKSGSARDSVRMALGQLADYGRFVPAAEKAVLLSETPHADLLRLMESQGVAAIWETRSGFKDNTGGRFT